MLLYTPCCHLSCLDRASKQESLYIQQSDSPAPPDTDHHHHPDILPRSLSGFKNDLSEQIILDNVQVIEPSDQILLAAQYRMCCKVLDFIDKARAYGTNPSTSTVAICSHCRWSWSLKLSSILKELNCDTLVLGLENQPQSQPNLSSLHPGQIGTWLGKCYG